MTVHVLSGALTGWAVGQWTLNTHPCVNWGWIRGTKKRDRFVAKKLSEKCDLTATVIFKIFVCDKYAF